MTIDPARPKKTPAGYILLGILLVVLWLLQSLPGMTFTLFGVRPLALPMLVTAIGIYYGYVQGALYGLAAGLLMDLYTTPAIGFHTVLMVMMGIGCGIAVRHFLMRNAWSSVVVCLIMSLSYYLLYFLILKLPFGMESPFYYLLRFSLPATVMTAVVGWGICFVVRWIRKIP